MKQYKILIVGILILLFAFDVSFAQTREILFCDGSVATTSRGWTNFIHRTTNRFDYGLSGITTNGYDQALENGIIPLAEYLDESVVNHNKTNVLGLAHCIGGLGLRQAQLQNSEINAMVLNGVPNQSSNIIDHLTRLAGSGETTVQLTMNNIKTRLNLDDCDKCGAFEEFKNWVDEFSANRSYISEASFRNFGNYGTPSVPYIIMYGLINTSDFSYLKMVDSRSGASAGIVSDCDKERKAIEEQFDKHEKLKRTVRFATNFFTFSNGLGGLALGIATGDAKGTLNSLKDIINVASKEILDRIETDFKNDQKTAQRLRCLLAEQLLEAEWLTLMGGDIERVETEYEDNDPAALYDCLADCEQQYGNNNTRDIFICIDDCYQDYYWNPIIATKIDFYLIQEPSDGLYRQSEMQLSSGNQVGEDIIFYGVNHFDETEHDVIGVVFETQIFRGTNPYGMAFKVDEK